MSVKEERHSVVGELRATRYNTRLARSTGLKRVGEDKSYDGAREENEVPESAECAVSMSVTHISVQEC